MLKVLNDSGLTEREFTIIASVLEKYPEVEAAILYGSRSRGTFKRGSDVDIALKGEKLTSEICLKIRYELNEETILF